MKKKTIKITNEKKEFSVQSFNENLLVGDDIVLAFSKYEAKQLAKRKYPTATNFNIRGVDDK